MESEDEDDDDDDDLSDEVSSLLAKNNAVKNESLVKLPFADEAEASKNLRQYTKQSSLNVDRDLVLTSSGLNIVKSLLPRTLQLMTLSRGNFAFDLFLQLS